MPGIYYVSVSYSGGGSAWANPQFGEAGASITIGYHLNSDAFVFDHIIVTRASTGAIVYRGSSTSFTMPADNVNVMVSFSNSGGGGGGGSGLIHSVTINERKYNASGEIVDGSDVGLAWGMPLSAVKDTLITVSYHAYNYKGMDPYVFDHMTVAASDEQAVPLIGTNQFLMPDANVSVLVFFKKGGSSSGGGGSGSSGSGGDYDQPDIKSRAISVPSIVKYYTDKGEASKLNRRYQCKEDYERAIQKYGAIYKTVNFSETSETEQLKAFGNEWILNNYYDGVVSFSVKAVDLHMLGYDKDQLICGDMVPVEFRDYYQEQVTKTFTCLSAQIDPLHPENSTYKIGIPGVSDDPKYRIAANLVKSVAETNKAQSDDAKKAEIAEAMKAFAQNNDLDTSGIDLNYWTKLNINT